MTLQAYTPSGPFDANGSDVDFSFGFRITLASQLVVTRTDASEVETTLVEGINYTLPLSSINNEDGGTITTFGPLSPHPTGEKITLSRIVPLTQDTDITTGSKFDAVVHEDTFDIITMGLQQLDELFTRAIILPISDDTGATLTLPTPAASQLIGWTATPPFALRNYDIPSITQIGLSDIDNSLANNLDIIQDIGGVLTYVAPSAAFTNIALTSLSTAGAVLDDAIVFDGANWAPGTLATPTIDLTTDVTGILPDANMANDLTMVGGTIDNSPIGVTTPHSGAFTTLSSTGLTTAATLTSTGLATFSASMLSNSTSPGWVLFESDAGLDQKLWTIAANGEAFSLSISSDDGLGGSPTGVDTVFTVQRSGTGASVVVDSVTFKAETVTAASINSAIAGTGLTYLSGVLSVTGGGTVNVEDIVTTGSPNDVIFDNAGTAAWGTISVTIDLTTDVTGILPNANVAEDLTISGGTVNNSIIGGVTPAAITGTTITSTGLLTGATLAVTGLATFSANILSNSASPGHTLFESDAGLDQKLWVMAANGEAFTIGITSDDGLGGAPTGAATFLTVERSGTGASVAIDSVTFNEGNVVVTAGDFDVLAGTGHIANGPSTATANSTADDFIVESNATNTGISILSTDANTGRLAFGTPSDNFGAFLDWDFTANFFVVSGAKVGAKLRLSADNQVSNLTLSGVAGSQKTEVHGLLNFTGTLAASTVDPSTHVGTDDWLEVEIGGTSFFAPLYNAT